MSSAGPWSVKGIDPKAREVAKGLARRSGMTLGEWLNQMIIEGEAEPPPPESFVYEPEPPPRQRAARLQAGPQRRPDDYEARPAQPGRDVDRLTRALDAFSDRLEAAEHRSTLAISGIDQSVMGLLSRLDGMERSQSGLAGRFEGSLDEVRAAQSKLADQVRRMEQDDGPRVEAMKALESALGRVAAQIYEGESRTRGAITEVRQDVAGIARRVYRLEATPTADSNAQVVDAVVSRLSERLVEAESRTASAVQALEASFSHLDERLGTSFTHLDERLKTAETKLAPPEAPEDTPERRFERLAAELSERVEASRAELAEHMRAAADGKLDRMETALRDLTGLVESSERQSAEAIDRMGHEVMRIAQSLGQRVTQVETRSAEAVEHVGGEMTRIADAMENRMRSADTAQAQALEKLGGEIGKIAERLAERIAASERRAATAIDEVGDQVSRVTDKINTRYERSASELSERIRQSEERTAKLLEEARETLDRRLIEAQRRTAIDAAVQAVEAPAPTVADFDDDFTPASFARPAAQPATAESFHEEAFHSEPFPDDPFAATAPAPAAEPTDAPKGLSAFLSKKKKKKENATVLRTALLASAVAAALSSSFVGYHMLSEGKAADGGEKTGAPRDATPLVASASAPAQPTQAASDADLLATALTPAASDNATASASTASTAVQAGAKPAAAQPAKPAAPALAGAPTAAAPVSSAVDPKQVYSSAVRQIESGDNTGVEALTRAANLGYPPGPVLPRQAARDRRGGVKKDANEARLWTERAAQSGDAKAMHNLGLYYFEGTGGAKNTTEAATWFHKAADAGLVDSQYKLARLYEQGYGVAQNPAEAYKWYLIASAGGDQEARSSADRLGKQLTPETVQAAQRSASAFRPQSSTVASK